MLNELIHSDAFGRMVIPKIARKQLGVNGPADWSLEVQSSALVLKPARSKPGRWQRRGKTWVLTGVPPVNPVESVHSLREEL